MIHRNRARSMASASVALTVALALLAGGCSGGKSQTQASAAHNCPAGNGGLVLPPGFCATVFADTKAHVRHMAIAADGTVYANSQPGKNDTAPAGLIVLRDTNGDGRADSISHPKINGRGGTGVALYDGAIYLEDGDRIIRAPLDPKTRLPAGRPQVLVTGLATDGDHHSHSIAITQKGEMFVNSGSATNACQVANRQPGSPGTTPCAEKQVRAGIWHYDVKDANVAPQAQTVRQRYASGIRNAVGLALTNDGQLFATQHGRDQLHENWPALYNADQGQNLPAEELLRVNAGADYGWPECYFDPQQRRLVLAPEYGGDGGRAVGVCAGRAAPVAAFPAHWAPNALAIYEARQFPTVYQGGAFIAFHGSWNRAPGPQGGFNIVFQPMRGGRASGDYVVFADGFAGPGKESGDAVYRPSGLAVAPDGALFVSDDKAGRIWRITYQGAADAALAGVKVAAAAAANRAATPPADGGAPLPVPPGSSAAAVALGKRLYAGEIAGAPCAGCHGSRGEGTTVGPDLADREWLWSKGDVAGIRHTIVTGVAKPKRYAAPMPPYGGATLTPAQTDAIAAYIWAISHPK